MHYKKECYLALWQHFHGRFNALIEKINIEEEISELETELATNDSFRRIRELEDLKKKLPSKLQKMDKELLSGQIRMEV